MTLYINNDNLLILDGLKDATPGVDAYVNNATVSAELKDPDGSTVSGAGSIAMSYVTGSDGKYFGVIEDDVPLVEGASYTATIDVDAGSDKIAQFNPELRAKEREDT